MVKLTEANIDAEIDKLAEKFKDMVSKEPHPTIERFTKIFMFQEPDRMPVFMQIHDHAARVAGITVRELCTDPKKMMYAQLFTAIKYKFDIPGAFADAYNYEAEALGAKMLFPEDSFPVILEPLIKEPKDLEKLDIPDFTKAGRGPYVIEGSKLYLEKLGEYAFTTLVASAPWSMAVQIRGFNNLVRDTRKNPEFAHKILDFCVDVIEAFIKAQKEALGGVAAFPALADAFSCIPPTNPQIVYDYVIPHTTEIMKRLGPMMWAGGFPIVEIPGWERIMEDVVVKTGSLVGMVVMLESDWLPPEKIKEMSNRLKKPWFFGVRAGIISKGTPKEIENHVKKLIKVLAPGGGCMVFGDQVPRDTPPENVEALVNSIKKYGKYPISI
ncbi:MAG: uroporphyrinogen decarboxylase family protein [Candidatus Freyarchaeota archaeon]